MSTNPVSRADAGLASVLRVAVMRLRRRLVSEHAPDNDLSIGSMAVLGALAKSGRATVGELAAHERVQPPSMTRTVGCLADGGYVDRHASETDRRQVIVAITDKGRATLEADKRRREEWLARRLATLTPEERAVLKSATPILEKLASAG